MHFVLIRLIFYVNTRFGYELCDEVKKLKIAVDVSRIFEHHTYCKVSNIRRTLVGHRIVDHSDVVGASPVGAAPTTYSLSLNTWLQWIGQRQLQDETRNIYVLGLGASYIRELTVIVYSSLYVAVTTTK